MNGEVKRVIALGFFDGAHKGHAALLETAKRRATEKNMDVAVMTFDLHPDNLIAGKPTPLINSKADRVDVFSRCYGIHDVIFLHFDRKMMHKPWQEFVDECLVRDYNAKHVVCGYDFRFGDRGLGTAELLAEKCAELGIGCDIIPRYELEGITVSSTYIRELIANGEIEKANRFLGHPHCMSGEVVHGKQLGRTIGTPTANIMVPEGVLEPAFGVYATKVVLPDGRVYSAVTNVGIRPTVEDSNLVTVEPWILDFDEDLYGKTIRVDFYKRLRGEKKFAGLKELQQEILHNADQTRALFENMELPD